MVRESGKIYGFDERNVQITKKQLISDGYRSVAFVGVGLYISFYI